MEWILLTTFGLILDIVGAIVIVKPLLTMVRRIKDERYKTEELISKHDPRDKAKEDADVQKYSRCGVGFLIAGFIFQLSANWCQYLTNLPK